MILFKVVAVNHDYSSMKFGKIPFKEACAGLTFLHAALGFPERIPDLKDHSDIIERVSLFWLEEGVLPWDEFCSKYDFSYAGKRLKFEYLKKAITLPNLSGLTNLKAWEFFFTYHCFTILFWDNDGGHIVNVRREGDKYYFYDPNNNETLVKTYQELFDYIDWYRGRYEFVRYNFARFVEPNSG